MANRLVLAAHVIGFACEAGISVALPALQEYADFFIGTSRDIFCRFPSRRSLVPPTQLTRKLARKAVDRLDCRTRRLRIPFVEHALIEGRLEVNLTVDWLQQHSSALVFINNYNFRAEDTVIKHADTIREYFRPVPWVEAKAAEALQELRGAYDVVIGVHIRHGDYRTWEGGKYFIAVADYARMMAETAAAFPGSKVAFLVCSDEPRSKDEFPGLAVNFGPGKAVTDLYALANCDYLIGSFASSYVRWAAFYGHVPIAQVRCAQDSITGDSFERLTELLG